MCDWDCESHRKEITLLHHGSNAETQAGMVDAAQLEPTGCERQGMGAMSHAVCRSGWGLVPWEASWAQGSGGRAPKSEGGFTMACG